MSERRAKIGHWQLSVRDQAIFWSAETFRLHDRDPSLGTPKVADALAFYVGEDRERVSEYVQTSMAEGSPFSYSARIRTEQGRTKDVLVHGVTEMENGLPKLVFGTIQDVSEIRTIARQRDQLFSLPLCMLAIANSEGSFTYLNEMWHKTLGWSLNELKTRPFLDFVHPDDQSATLIEFKQLMEVPHHKTLHFQNRYRNKDGGWCWFSWSAIRGEDGNIYASAIDVTPIKEAQMAKEPASSAGQPFTKRHRMG
jgi:PAS domain S-box-containing protein